MLLQFRTSALLSHSRKVIITFIVSDVVCVFLIIILQCVLKVLHPFYHSFSSSFSIFRREKPIRSDGLDAFDARGANNVDFHSGENFSDIQAELRTKGNDVLAVGCHYPRQHPILRGVSIL